MLPLPLVLADDLPPEWREVLRPGQALTDGSGRARVLPSSFLRVDSWQQALETSLTPNFKAWELIGVDVRETMLARSFPRYVPCAIAEDGVNDTRRPAANTSVTAALPAANTASWMLFGSFGTGSLWLNKGISTRKNP